MKGGNSPKERVSRLMGVGENKNKGTWGGGPKKKKKRILGKSNIELKNF